MEIVLIVSSILLWIAVLFNLFLSLALVRLVNKSKIAFKMDSIGKTLKVGEAAPNFTAETLQGQPVTLADYAERAVVFIFFDSGCGPCREEMPHLEALFPKAWTAGVELVLVSVEDREATQAFVTEFNIRMPVLVAPRASNSFMNDYQAMGTPFFCMVDMQGRVQSTGFFGPEWDILTAQFEDVSNVELRVQSRLSMSANPLVKERR